MAQPTPPVEIADLLREDRTFPPSDGFRSKANVRDEDVYARAERDPEAFWAGFAEELEWFSKWTHVLTWSPPHAKWFVDGTINASVIVSTVTSAGRAATRPRSSGKASQAIAVR